MPIVLKLNYLIIIPVFLLFATKNNFSQQWQQVGADIDGENQNDHSGAVAISGDGLTVAIGAYDNDDNGNKSGHVRIFEFNAGGWSQLGTDIDGPLIEDEFGCSVDLNNTGDIVAIGGRYNDITGTDAGITQVYEWNGTSWNQIGSNLLGEAGGDNSGWSVSLNDNGNKVAIGAINNDGTGPSAGHVRIYELVGGSWSQIGQDIDGEADYDGSGIAVDLNGSGDKVIIGAYMNDGGGAESGHARIFEFNGTNWVKMGQDIDGENANDRFGTSVSINNAGDKVAIGAPFNDGNGTNSGHTQIYEWVGSSWLQIGQDIDGEAANDRSGVSISLNDLGNRIAIGATHNDGNGTNSGHLSIYELIGGNWLKIGQDIDGESPNDLAGQVALNDLGDYVALGAEYNDGNNTNNNDDRGHVRIFKESCDSYTTIDTTVCFGFSATINGNLYNAANPTGIDTFNLIGGCDSIVYINLTESQEINDTIFQSICAGETFIYDGTVYDSTNLSGTHSYINNLGCDSTITILINIQYTINSNIDSTLCEGDSLVINNTTYDINNPSGQQVVSLASGCDSVFLINLSFYNPDTAYIDTILYPGESLNFDGLLINQDFDNYISINGSYGCDSIIYVKVDMIPENTYFIPNGFSPNGDGLNDKIGVMGGGIKDVELSIFNRWGELLFQSSCCCQMNCYWDGKFRNKDLNVGTYIYIVNGHYINGKPFNGKGTISLIK